MYKVRPLPRSPRPISARSFPRLDPADQHLPRSWQGLAWAPPAPLPEDESTVPADVLARRKFEADNTKGVHECVSFLPLALRAPLRC